MTRSSVALTGVLAGLLLAAPPVDARERRVDVAPPAPTAHAPDRVIVGWAPRARAADRRAARAEASAVSARRLGDPAVQLLELGDGRTVREAVDALEADPAVEFAEPDRYNVPTAGSDEPLFGELWGLRNAGGPFGVLGFPGPLAGADVGAVGAWTRTVGAPSTVVAVIDSGYRFSHPDLGSVAWVNPGEAPGNGVDDDGNGYADDVHGYDFVGEDADDPAPDGDPTDGDLLSGGHGVHTAGTIGADGDNGVGISGVAQDARLMPLRVCAHSPDASAEEPPAPRSSCPDSALIDAIDYAGDNGARVANVSLGREGEPSQGIRDALGRHPETLYVISAGNDGSDNDSAADPPEGHHHYPCDHDPSVESDEPGAIDNVVCVAATDQADRLADFSNWGAASVDLAAPGTETLSAYVVDRPLADDFELDDFSTGWAATGADGGFSRTGESPLGSHGISDSPGAVPAANTVRASTSAPVTIPAGYPSCDFFHRRSLSVGTGSYRVAVLLDGSPVLDLQRTSSGYFVSDVDLQDGGELRVRFTYSSGAGPLTNANGAWIDDVSVECPEPVGATNSYAYLQGTSMAAPHVAGAAGLLFSLKPSATVPEVRGALLASVDPLAGLAGLTVTGGRLDAAAALDALVAPGAPSAVGSGASAAGSRTPAAAPAPIHAAAPGCRVPKLRGVSRRRARAALARANCRLGRVTQPRRRRGQRRLPPLVVRSSTPAAGAERAAGAKVAVKLGPKPKRRKRR